MRQLLLLVGPKGAGKTHIGEALERRGVAEFVRVEPMFIRAQADHRDGQHDVLEELRRRAVCEGPPVCIETTGASREMLETYERELPRSFDVRWVRVSAPLDECARRVAARSPTNHIAVSDDRVREVNALAAKVTMEWSAEIDTRDSPNDDDIVACIERVLARS